MSDRDTFVAARAGRWQQLEALLGRARFSAADWQSLGSLYRGLCADLARAQSLDLPKDVLDYLDDLAGRSHNTLYSGRENGLLRQIPSLVFAEFPRELRTQWRFFLLASLLFYAPFVAGAVGAFLDPGFATSVLPESTLAEMEEMYRADIGRETAGDDAAMAGFYVRNNVGIALRCFVTGIFAGLGSIFFLVYNGLVMGVIEGYLWAAGRGINLLTFTAGHTAWELTGIVVAGTAGLRLGWAVVATDGRTRGGSLRRAGPSLYRLVLGATALLFVAAAIEGFWSGSPLPAPIKWAFGLLQVGVVALWLLFGGRR